MLNERILNDFFNQNPKSQRLKIKNPEEFGTSCVNVIKHLNNLLRISRDSEKVKLQNLTFIVELQIV